MFLGFIVQVQLPPPVTFRGQIKSVHLIAKRLPNQPQADPSRANEVSTILDLSAHATDLLFLSSPISVEV